MGQGGGWLNMRQAVPGDGCSKRKWTVLWTLADGNYRRYAGACSRCERRRRRPGSASRRVRRFSATRQKHGEQIQALWHHWQLLPLRCGVSRFGEMPPIRLLSYAACGQTTGSGDYVDAIWATFHILFGDLASKNLCTVLDRENSSSSNYSSWNDIQQPCSVPPHLHHPAPRHSDFGRHMSDHLHAIEKRSSSSPVVCCSENRS